MSDKENKSLDDAILEMRKLIKEELDPDNLCEYDFRNKKYKLRSMIDLTLVYKKKTPKWLAKRCNLSEKTINSIIKEPSTCSITDALKISAVLQMRVEYVFLLFEEHKEFMGGIDPPWG